MSARDIIADVLRRSAGTGESCEMKARWISTALEISGYRILAPGQPDDFTREQAAKIADEHCFARDIDWWLSATKKDVSAHACRSVAAAIRAMGEKL